MAKKQFKAESKRVIRPDDQFHLHPQGDLLERADQQCQRRAG